MSTTGERRRRRLRGGERERQRERDLFVFIGYDGGTRRRPEEETTEREGHREKKALEERETHRERRHERDRQQVFEGTTDPAGGGSTTRVYDTV